MFKNTHDNTFFLKKGKKIKSIRKGLIHGSASESMPSFYVRFYLWTEIQFSVLVSCCFWTPKTEKIKQIFQFLSLEATAICSVYSKRKNSEKTLLTKNSLLCIIIFVLWLNILDMKAICRWSTRKCNLNQTNRLIQDATSSLGQRNDQNCNFLFEISALYFAVDVSDDSAKPSSRRSFGQLSTELVSTATLSCQAIIDCFCDVFVC